MPKLNKFRLEHKTEVSNFHVFEVIEIGPDGKRTGRLANFTIPRKEGGPSLGEILLQANRLPSSYRGDFEIAASVQERFARPRLEVFKLAEQRSLELMRAIDAFGIECRELGSFYELLDLLEKAQAEVGLFYGKVFKMREAKEQIKKAVTGKTDEQVQDKKEKSDE
jgi:hypothetical protein